MTDKAPPTTRIDFAVGPTRIVTFADTYRAEFDAMVALAAAVSGSRVHAEDIAQEALARLERKWESVGSYDKPGAWLRRVTINLALNSKRRQVRELKSLIRLSGPQTVLGPAPAEHAEIWELVGALPKMQRAVIGLHFLEDRTITEMAEILELAEPTVRVHLHRARRSLHTALTSKEAER